MLSVPSVSIPCWEGEGLGHMSGMVSANLSDVSFCCNITDTIHTGDTETSNTTTTFLPPSSPGTLRTTKCYARRYAPEVVRRSRTRHLMSPAPPPADPHLLLLLLRRCPHQPPDRHSRPIFSAFVSVSSIHSGILTFSRLHSTRPALPPPTDRAPRLPPCGHVPGQLSGLSSPSCRDRGNLGVPARGQSHHARGARAIRWRPPPSV